MIQPKAEYVATITMTLRMQVAPGQVPALSDRLSGVAEIMLEELGSPLPETVSGRVSCVLRPSTAFDRWEHKAAEEDAKASGTFGVVSVEREGSAE